MARLNCTLFGGFLTLAFALLFALPLKSQGTVGTLQLEPNATSGYILFSPNGSETTYLIDRCGREIHHWQTDGRPGLMAYLMENGDLVRTRRHQTGEFAGGGIGGIIERLDWDGNVIWRDTLATANYHQHHDIAVMPNGNILAILWEKWFAEDAIARGQLPELASEEIWVTRLVELHPLPGSGSEVIWSWSPWEHLIQDTDPALPNYGQPSEHPGRFDVNYEATAEASGPGFGQEAAYDWMHVNSVNYDAERDEIVLSSRHWNELWLIDHSTTSEEAASSTGGQHGRGGDLLWRWGNPAAYGRGTTQDQQLYGQHDAQFTPLSGAPSITVYNNGAGRPEGQYSTVHRLPLPLDESGGYIQPESTTPFAPDEPSWTYPQTPDWGFFSANVSGYQWLPNGHHLICQGASGRFFELDDQEAVVWDYINPINNLGPIQQGATPLQNGVFRALAIPLDHPGLVGRDLTPGAPLELNPLPFDCSVGLLDPVELMAPTVWPNPATTEIRISPLPPGASNALTIYNGKGQAVWRGAASGEAIVDIQFWPPGMYIGILHATNLPPASPAQMTFKFLVE